MTTTYTFEDTNGGYVGQVWACSATEALNNLNADRNRPVPSCHHVEGGHCWPIRITARPIRMDMLPDGLHCARSAKQF